jgi:hypothetical protein
MWCASWAPNLVAWEQDRAVAFALPSRDTGLCFHRVEKISAEQNIICHPPADALSAKPEQATSIFLQGFGLRWNLSYDTLNQLSLTNERAPSILFLKMLPERLRGFARVKQVRVIVCWQVDGENKLRLPQSKGTHRSRVVIGQGI